MTVAIAQLFELLSYTVCFQKTKSPATIHFISCEITHSGNLWKKWRLNPSEFNTVLVSYASCNICQRCRQLQMNYMIGLSLGQGRMQIVIDRNSRTPISDCKSPSSAIFMSNQNLISTFFFMKPTLMIWWTRWFIHSI